MWHEPHWKSQSSWAALWPGLGMWWRRRFSSSICNETRLLWTEAIFRSRQSQERLRPCGKIKRAKLPINLQWALPAGERSWKGSTGEPTNSTSLLLLPFYLDSGQCQSHTSLFQFACCMFCVCVFLQVVTLNHRSNFLAKMSLLIHFHHHLKIE